MYSTKTEQEKLAIFDKFVDDMVAKMRENELNYEFFLHTITGPNKNYRVIELNRFSHETPQGYEISMTPLCCQDIALAIRVYYDPESPSTIDVEAGGYYEERIGDRHIMHEVMEPLDHDECGWYEDYCIPDEVTQIFRDLERLFKETHTKAQSRPVME